MNRCLLVLLLDAFRPDYLAHTRFLRQLAASGAVGHLVETFGFCPRAAYFGGLSPKASGFTNMYWYDPDRSPFRPALFLSGRYPDPVRERAMREEITRYARTRVPPYAAHYVNTASIPIERLRYFDVAEKHAPYAAAAGYESVFSLLDRKKMPWYALFWPLTNALPRADDEEILGTAMAALERGHRLAFIHFQALDGIGHAFGPSSDESLAALEKIDRQVECLASHCHALYDRLDMVVFGDHGMVDVVGTVDLDARIREAGLAFGNDYVAFYDSTMARFWCANRHAEIRLRGVLEGVREGWLLSDPEKAAWEIDDCDPRNGQLYFLAHPGTVIFPNFFQAGGPMVKGMHGYAPDVADNKGIFILNDWETKGQLGDVRATQLFHTMVDLLGLEDGGRPHGPSARRQAAPAAPDGPRYTMILTRDQESVIDAHLAAICRELRVLDPLREAIVLTGGFGRGEGSIALEGGQATPLNDYDVMLISRSKIDRGALKQLGQRLARELKIDFVDLGIVDPGSLGNLTLSQFVFDLKYGSRVLEGDPTILDRIPRFSARGLPPTEATRLLFNRMAGMLYALPEYALPGSPDSAAGRLLAFQLAKMWIAVGDAHLISWGGYDASYLVRRDRFASLRRSGRISDAVAGAVAAGFDFKLGLGRDIAVRSADYLSLLLERLPDLLADMLCRAYGMSRKNETGTADLLDTWIGSAAGAEERELRAVWAAVAVLLQSHVENSREPGLRRAAAWLQAGSPRPGSYPELRSIAWSAWERKCH
ncbi:MAG: alkaline phosphatase family protein [Betaproteobacteria bacterium]|nr:alkaline phosphatase family protein [Betaproteobacteria bacterium]